MKAGQWIDRVKEAKGFPSDYAAAKHLGITRNAISNYRSGARNTLDEETALKVAQALGVDPAGIIIDQVAERSKDAGLSTALHRVARQLCILCKAPAAVVKKSRILAPVSICTGFPLHFPSSQQLTA